MLLLALLNLSQSLEKFMGGGLLEPVKTFRLDSLEQSMVLMYLGTGTILFLPDLFLLPDSFI